MKFWKQLRLIGSLLVFAIGICALLIALMQPPESTDARRVKLSDTPVPMNKSGL